MPLSNLYQTLKKLAKQDLKSPTTRVALKNLISASLDYIENAETAPLVSKVAGKTYDMRALGGRYSRPVNISLFKSSVPKDDLFTVVFNMEPPYDFALLDQFLYTAAMSYPIANDLAKDGDKKSPGTFFEMLIGHIVASRYGVNPRTSIQVPTLDIENLLPTDFIFELGKDRRVHLPVKISTRERVVQVWAHQKLLDGMHGVGRFTGVLICLTETNKQKNTSVVEVCLPGQWAAYQMYIARLDRVYYVDPPLKYLALRHTYPHIQVWPLSKFFEEADDIFMSNPA